METLVMCLSVARTTTRLKSISKKGFSSKLKLVTEKERHLTTET